MERFLEASADLDVPVLVGILPLASYRKCPPLRARHEDSKRNPDRMKDAGRGDSARQKV